MALRQGDGEVRTDEARAARHEDPHHRTITRRTLTTCHDAAGGTWTFPSPSGSRVYAGAAVLAAADRPRRTLALVDWADEEGARFGHSLLGSSAACGLLDVDAAATLTDADGVALPDALAAHGVTSAVKHFPGLGRVEGNTDDATDVTDTVTTRDDEQVAAFGTLAGSPAAPFVMTSSATYALIDPSAPAAFSPVIVTDLLREQLGFDGVVISDDIGAAQAVQDIPAEERAIRFLEAGGTLMLTMDAGLVTEMIDAIVARAANDPEFSATVDAAVRTALIAKADAGLLPGA